MKLIQFIHDEPSDGDLLIAYPTFLYHLIKPLIFLYAYLTGYTIGALNDDHSILFHEND